MTNDLWTSKEMVESVLTALCLGFILGGCAVALWFLFLPELSQTGRVMTKAQKAASVLSKEGQRKRQTKMDRMHDRLRSGT